MKNARIFSVGEPQGKKPVARNRPRWKDIKIDFKEIGWKMWTEFFWLGTGTRCWLL